jgi:hypothetical protein
MFRLLLAASLVCLAPAISLAESEKVTRNMFGKAWPLTVDEGILSCTGAKGLGVVTFEAKGTRYAVNGVAMSQKKYADIGKIWAPDPSGIVPKKNLGPLLERGLKLCK